MLDSPFLCDFILPPLQHHFRYAILKGFDWTFETPSSI